jgi:hypothetical protein
VLFFACKFRRLIFWCDFQGSSALEGCYPKTCNETFITHLPHSFWVIVFEQCWLRNAVAQSCAELHHRLRCSSADPKVPTSPCLRIYDGSHVHPKPLMLAIHSLTCPLEVANFHGIWKGYPCRCCFVTDSPNPVTWSPLASGIELSLLMTVA